MSHCSSHLQVITRPLGPPEELATDLTYYNFAEGAFSQECTTCHGEHPSVTSTAYFNLSQYDDRDAIQGVASMREKITARITNDTMPPNGWVDHSNRSKLLAWLESGAPLGEAPPTEEPSAVASFLAPLNPNDLASSQHYALQFQFEHFGATATYDLYQQTSAAATPNGTLIAQDIPITQTIYDWDVTNVAASTYYFYMIIHDDEQTSTVYAPGSVVVPPHPSVNQIPTVALSGIFQNGNAAIVRNAATTLTYSAADADGDSLTYAFQYSSNNGSNWNAMTCASPTATQCTWDTTGFAQGVQYKVRITVQDPKGGAATATSTNAFGIASTTITYLNFVSTLMTNQCNGCHSPASNGFDSGTENTVKSSANRIIVRAVNEMTMPQVGPLPLNDRIDLQLWYWLGAP